MSTISRLMIEQQFATVGIETTNARLHITTPRPQMAIENVGPEMTIDRENPSFELDWQQVRNQSGLRAPVNLSKNAASKAVAQASNGVMSAVREGDYLGKAEQPGNRVSQMARQKYNPPTKTEINLGLMPQQKPDVKWDPGHININWSRHKLIVEWDTEYMPEFKVDPPYSVEIFLRDKPYIKISIVEGEAPYAPGKVVDAKY